MGYINFDRFFTIDANRGVLQRESHPKIEESDAHDKAIGGHIQKDTIHASTSPEYQNSGRVARGWVANCETAAHSMFLRRKKEPFAHHPRFRQRLGSLDTHNP